MSSRRNQTNRSERQQPEQSEQPPQHQPSAQLPSPPQPPQQPQPSSVDEELDRIIAEELPQELEDPVPPAPVSPTTEIVPAAVAQPPVPPAFDMQAIFGDFQNISNDVIATLSLDKAMADRVIQFLWERTQRLGVNDIDSNNRVYIEQLVSAMATKADISSNTVKILETKAKMLSAGKGTVLINQQFGGHSLDNELDDVLSKPVEDDER